MTPAYQSSCVFPFLLICFRVSSSCLGTRTCGTAVHLVPCLSLFWRLVSFRHSHSWICCPPCVRPTCLQSLLLSNLFSHRILFGTTTNLAAAIIATPDLQSLFLDDLHPSGSVQEAIGKFIAARQLTNHPITVSHWDGKI